MERVNFFLKRISAMFHFSDAKVSEGQLVQCMTPVRVLRHIRAAKNSSLEGQGRHLFCMRVASHFHPETSICLKVSKKEGMERN